MGGSLAKSRFDAAFVVRMIGIVLFAYFFFGFMLLPCLNTLTRCAGRARGCSCRRRSW